MSFLVISQSGQLVVSANVSEMQFIHPPFNLVIVGVEVKERSAVKSVSTDKESGKTTVELENGESLTVDHVVVAIGIEPRVDLARDAGLEIDEKRSGVVVNAELEARRDVYAAGDMVSFHDVQLGRRRIEHHDQ